MSVGVRGNGCMRVHSMRGDIVYDARVGVTMSE